MVSNKYDDLVNVVVDEVRESLLAVNNEEIEEFVARIKGARKIFFIGVGRVFLSLQSMAKRFAHIGLDVHLVGEITEPAMTSDDILIVGSGSGSSIIPVVIVKKAKALGAKIIHIGSNRNGSISEYTDLMVRIPVRTKEYLKDEINSIQPMTSLFEQSLLMLGDIIAMKLICDEKIDLESLWRKHANLE